MFKRLDPRDINITPWKAYKEFTVTNVDSGSGVYGFRAVSSSIQGFDTDTSAKTTFSSASFYHLPTWFMINRMYYKDTGNNFNNFGQNNGKQYRLLQPSASIISVPQKLFGERIKPGSFQLTGRSGSVSSSTKEITILDDGNGNLYSSNLHKSYSNTAFSSSDNYVGNIFYDLGIAALTETGSWSGSVKYLDIGGNSDEFNRNYPFWNINFNSVTPIFTSQYTIKIPAGQFNHTMNATTRPYGTGDWMPSGSSIQSVANRRDELNTGSFSPYFTQIHLYRNKVEEPVMIANLPKAIKMRDDVDLIITFRVDH